MVKLFFAVLLSAFWLTAGAAADAAAAEISPLELYGEEAVYAVESNGEAAGVHRLTFAGGADNLQVSAQTRATLKVLGFLSVPFLYDSAALWKNGEIVSLSASYSRGDAPIESSLWQTGEEYKIQSGATMPPPVFPTNHWNIGAVRQTVLFNTLNGKFNKVKISPAGEETLLIGGEKITAQKFDVRGDLEISLWYGAGGKWLKLQFAVLGGDYTFTYQPNKAKE